VLKGGSYVGYGKLLVGTLAYSPAELVPPDNIHCRYTRQWWAGECMFYRACMHGRILLERERVGTLARSQSRLYACD
jgi:hypothetical protein